MQVEIASVPPAAKSQYSWDLAGRLVLPAVIVATLMFELALAERKYALFGGGFGQSQTLDAPLEILAFFGALLACHALLFYLIYRLIRRLHGRRAQSPLFQFNFACFAGLGAIGLIVAKYQALAYFSDAMSFQIVRNLGGGSLADALLYSLSEAGLVLIATAGFVVCYVTALMLVRRRWRDAPPLPDRVRLSGRQLLLALAGAPLLLFAANQAEDARPALARFTAVSAFAMPLHFLTDFDRDGWSFYSFPLDRQPFDGSRHPYALDVPNNGIDEDGYGGDLGFAAAPIEIAPAAIPGRKRHVILIVLESTRADAIGMRVSGRPVTPVLEALAAQGSAAEEAYSHVGFTTQSLQSLFTGRLAPADDRQSLVRDFLANGYRVGIFSGQSEDFGGIAATTGMRRGEIFVDANTLREERVFSFAAEGSLHVDGKVLLREFDRRLGRREAWDRPTFLYFNFQSAHFPYAFPGMDRILPGEPIPRARIGADNRDWVARTYWNAVAYNDRLIGALLARLERLGIRDDSLVVVTADHGESLFDDGFLGHGHALNAQQTRIPFILSDPEVPISGPVGLADMRAIILRAAGAQVAGGTMDGGVFQYLGELDRPGTIGRVGRRGAWIRFDLFREAVWTSETQRWVSYNKLTGAQKAEADALIDEWAKQRWMSRLEAAR
ncbi:sulfatase-like hydrolase/transferase [Sphingosinicella sp. CPCC 101087]|uniref:sulfatase-like hydrolase/transferase n=1 Tax=Sphingosinicella sp. CPCC 101087 TaxID=2497754 RepID=UPI00101CD8CA|nr:sulfatase-like hydrolase/transferase [Sphingosinicella sp. CPCC 101087]